MRYSGEIISVLAMGRAGLGRSAFGGRGGAAIAISRTVSRGQPIGRILLSLWQICTMEERSPITAAFLHRFFPRS